MAMTMTIWTLVALIYALQLIGSFALIGLLGLRVSGFAVPLLLLFLGGGLALVFRSRDRNGHEGGWKPWLPVLIYAGFIFSLSSEPLTDVTISVSGDLFHPIEYATLALILSLATYPTFRKMGTTRFILAALAIGILYAISDEVHQSFVPGRDPSYTDLLLDAAGLLFGCWIFLILQRYLKPAAEPLSPRAEE